MAEKQNDYVTHWHECLKCGEKLPGFMFPAQLCNEPTKTLCSKCLARYFPKAVAIKRFAMEDAHG